ncbi:MAG: hypothetical protein ACO1SX_20410 [Actinomycetota bacterium]
MGEGLKALFGSGGPSPFARKMDGTRAEVLALDTGQARDLLEKAMADETRYRVTPGRPPDPECLDQLPELVQELFRRCERIASVQVSSELDRTEVRPSSTLPGYTVIGIDTEHTEIAVRGRDETIHIIETDIEPSRQEGERFPTIYHYLAFITLLYADVAQEP